jgi:DNA adenine methylase
MYLKVVFIYNTIMSLLRYPGGKTRACKTLENIIITRFGVPSVIISPFFGGGSFELYMTSKYPCTVYANDAYEPLITFWNTVKTHPHDLLQVVNAMVPVTREAFYNMRNNINDITDAIQKSAYYFALNRCSFSGVTMSGGFSKESSTSRFTESNRSKITSVNLQDISFTNKDFETFLSETEIHQDAIIFLDPPYFVDSKLYGHNGDMHTSFDHQRLQKCLQTYSNFVLCYNDCDFIRDLYKDYEILEVNWTYGMNKSKKSSEILIIG